MFSLPYLRRSAFALSVLLMIILGPSAVACEPEPTPKQIAQWVEQLGDNDFQVRENASKKLWQAGAAAEPALEKALKSDDPEMVRRARELLGKFRWGIYPDTPDEVVALIRAYQASADKPRMDILQKLLNSGEPGLRAVLKIALAEKNANQGQMLGDLIANKLPAAFSLAVIQDKYESFERLLELVYEGKFIPPHQYAAYWLLRGRLPERIASFAARLREHPDDKWILQTLAYLHRANGDLLSARQAAEKSGRVDLLEGILYELGDWKALAECPDFAAANNPAEKWAYRAAFARLAGKQSEFDKAVRELRKCTESFVAAKGLLLNDHPTEGLELLRTIPERRALLFDILCARLDFAAAMKLAEEKTSTHNTEEIPSLALARARLLCWLGEKEGEALFDRYAERIKDGVDPRWVQSLLREEMRAGLQDRAFAHAAKALRVAMPKQMREYQPDDAALLYLEQLFPQQTAVAKVWWIMLRRLQLRSESPATVLKHLRELLEGKMAAKEVRAWIEQSQHLARRGTDSWKLPDEWEDALAEAAFLAGLDELASSLLEKANSRSSLLRLGDLSASKKQWDKAAERYQLAWKKQFPVEGPRGEQLFEEEEHDPLPLYLAGDALVRAGREKAGKKLIAQAHRILFADAKRRYDFLIALSKRGHKQATRREVELMLRVSEPNSLYANDALRRLAFAALARKDYLQAAEDFEKSMLLCLQANVTFVEHAAYAEAPARIHTWRAVGLLTAGKHDAALHHAELALAASPGYADLPILLVPELERRGYKKEAADLFNRCYGTYEKLCRAYPRCAWAHNAAAWMAVCCRRNLDQALEHAQKAVELAPMRANYLDTLAEVYFQRGDKDKAIALQKRALALDPQKIYYRKQLKRLQAGDPSAERPPENDDE